MLMNHTNHTGVDHFSCYSLSVVGYRYFAVLWGCAVTVTGTLGNLMTILAFTLDPHLRTHFNMLTINLAVADLLYCTVLQPISVDTYLHLRWRSGQIWCSVFGLLLFLLNSVSIITLCLIALCRYLLVTKRAIFDCVSSNHGLGFLLIFSWALSLASFCPLWSVYDFVPNVCTCSFHRTRGRPYTTILLIVYFVFGLGFVGVFYLLIYRRVRIASRALLRYRLSHQSRMKPAISSQGTDDSGLERGTVDTCSHEGSGQLEQAETGTEINRKKTSAEASKTPAAKNFTSTTDPATPSKSPSLRDDAEFKHVTRMCFTVFLCFVICFVPFLVLNMADKDNKAPHGLHMFCANLTWLNSCINPILYAVMNRQFRQAYHMLLTRAYAPFTRLWVQI